jgi:glycerol-3-phosphate cytidylyltransferase
MSATIVHHGHIRLLCAAKKLGHVVIALTSDEEIIKHKGYIPELTFKHRKEILESIKYVDDVVPSKWLIDDEFLRLHSIDLLVHGDDNSNLIDPSRILILPRTKGISSTQLREKAAKIFLSTQLK